MKKSAVYDQFATKRNVLFSTKTSLQTTVLVPVLLNNFVSKGPGEGTGKSWEAKEGKVFPSGTFAYNLLDIYSQREIYLTSSYSGKINPKVHYSWFSRIKRHLAILSWLRRGKSSRRNRLIKVLLVIIRFLKN